MWMSIIAYQVAVDSQSQVCLEQVLGLLAKTYLTTQFTETPAERNRESGKQASIEIIVVKTYTTWHTNNEV
jgi:hypothetical protein